MKRRNYKRIILSGAIFILLTMISREFLTNIGFLDTLTVYQITESIPKGQKLDMKNMRKVTINREFVPHDAVLDIDKLRNGVVSDTLFKGDIITESRLHSNEFVQTQLSGVIQKGMRAISIPVDPIVGVSNLIAIGDRVDIVNVTESSTQNAPSTAHVSNFKEKKASIVLEAIEVIALDSKIPSSKSHYGDAYNTVTILVSPEDAIKVALALEIGTIKLILRNSFDDIKKQIPSILTADIIEQRGV